MNSPASITQLQNVQRQVDELQYHSNIKRIKVSDAAAQLRDYVLNNEARDFLLVKPPDNPFKPKSSCMFL